MKILHIYKSYYPESLGGVEKVIHGIASELNQYGVRSDVAVCSKQHTRRESVEPGEVYFFSSQWESGSCPISFSMLRHLKRLIKDYDVLHYHFPWPFGDLLHLLLNIKKPAVVTYHSDIVRQVILKKFYTPVMNQFFKRANRIVVTSQNLLTTSDALAKFQHKAHVVPIGINPTQYPEVPTSLLQSWQERVGNDFFLFVGVLRYYKGIDFLLNAVVGTDIRLVIAGSGPEQKKLQELARSLKLNNVTFLGKVTEEDKSALLTLCKGVISSAHLRSEAFCISLLEGLMWGKPLISTELGTGTSYVNTHGRSGLVVAPKNALALREAMASLLNDDRLYAQFQQGAKEHYLQHFTAQKMGQDYLQIYGEVI